jgi:transposase-like protein
MKDPQTLQEAIAYFADPDRAFAYAVKMRWLGGEITCPRCGKAKHSFIKTRRIWFCYVCKKQFTVKVGTVMEDSPIGLDKWMVAFWMMCNCKNGISSYELHRTLGIRQQSAWFMLHRIREAMKHKSMFKLGGTGGTVEADETYIGGKAINMHKSRKLKLQQIRGEERRGDVYLGKTAVQGILDRDLRQVRCKVIPNVKRETLQGEILKQVRYGSKVYTDSAIGYDLLHNRFVHDVVNHAERYVNGQVHTNGLENFWSLFKRNLRGTYVSVEPFHLDRYLDEQVFRYNNRATKDNPLNDSDRFVLAMSQVAGKRLTYAQLTGKQVDSLHHETAGTGQEEPF